MSFFMSERHIPKYLTNDLKKYFKSFESKKIQTNGNIACYLQDSEDYVHNVINNTLTSAKPYKMGSLNGVDVYVDPFQRWDDNRIHFFDKDDDTQKIASIDIDFRFYEEQSTNDERASKLKMLLDDDVEETNKFNEEQRRLEEFRRIANLDKTFRSFVFNLLEEIPEIKKIKTSSDICSKLDLFETRIKDLPETSIPDMTFTISFKLALFNGEPIPELDQKIFDGQLILYCDNKQITDEISFLDDNNNEIYKTNMSSI